MTLTEQLEALRAKAEARRSPEAVALMHRVVADLRASGIADRVLGAGRRIPGFELPDSEGRPVRSADLLARGPLVLTFYRGKW